MTATDLNIDGPHSPQQTREVASLAAEAIRFLNHATGHHAAAALGWPADADSVTGSMATLVMRLPQLLGQLGDWFERERAAGRLRIAYGPFEGDADAAVTELRRVLGFAGVTAEGVYSALNAAAQITAAIGAPFPAADEETGEGSDCSDG
jgi:hypothetical protein